MSSSLPPTTNVEDKVPVFMSLSDRVAQLYSQAPGSFFVAFYDSQGYGGAILTFLHTEIKIFKIKFNKSCCFYRQNFLVRIVYSYSVCYSKLICIAHATEKHHKMNYISISPPGLSSGTLILFLAHMGFWRWGLWKLVFWDVTYILLNYKWLFVEKRHNISLYWI
jgi:hypothetical protein